MTARDNLEQTVAQHRQRAIERMRNPDRITIELDETPLTDHYVEVREVEADGRDHPGILVRRIQPPINGRVVLHFQNGRCRGGERLPSMEPF